MVVTSSIPLKSIALILAICFQLLSLSYHSSPSSTGLMVEEKSRLGSTPPSCQNRCNLCHPCMAVQVPTTQSRRLVEPSFESGHDSSLGENRDSNYKPLGWKCRCEGHLYNPFD